MKTCIEYKYKIYYRDSQNKKSTIEGDNRNLRKCKKLCEDISKEIQNIEKQKVLSIEIKAYKRIVVVNKQPKGTIRLENNVWSDSKPKRMYRKKQLKTI